jgi:hypothetical protein
LTALAFPKFSLAFLAWISLMTWIVYPSHRLSLDTRIGDALPLACLTLAIPSSILALIQLRKEKHRHGYDRDFI